MPPLLQQARGATVLTIYMTDTHLPIYLLHTQTCTYNSSVHMTKTSHRLKRSEIFFHPEREKALPE